jgi:hypothetical protein
MWLESDLSMETEALYCVSVPEESVIVFMAGAN